MKSLQSIFPADLLRQRFGQIQLTEVGLDDWARLVELKGAALHEVGMTIWDLIVTRKVHDVDPLAISDVANTQNPDAAIVISQMLKRKTIFELYYARADARLAGKKKEVAEALVARIYPNEMHLADVQFTDPERPLSKQKRFRRPLAEFHGLGMLAPFMQRLEEVAVERKCNSITLTAATADHVELFARYGFAVPDTPRGKLGLMLGIGAPMERWL